MHVLAASCSDKAEVNVDSNFAASALESQYSQRPATKRFAVGKFITSLATSNSLEGMKEERKKRRNKGKEQENTK